MSGEMACQHGLLVVIHSNQWCGDEALPGLSRTYLAHHELKFIITTIAIIIIIIIITIAIAILIIILIVIT